MQKRKQIVLSDFALYMYVGEKVDMHFSVILNCKVLMIFLNITIITHTTLHVVMSRNIYLLLTTKDLIVCHYPIQSK